MKYEYTVTEIHGNSYMGTEYHEVTEDGHTIFCCGKITAKIGDKVQMNYSDDGQKLLEIYVNGKLEWTDIIQGKAENDIHNAWIEKRKKELRGGI